MGYSVKKVIKAIVIVSLFHSLAHSASREKFRATVINAAVGDILGQSPEFKASKEEIKKSFGPSGISSIEDVLKAQDNKRPYAFYTDDTVMSVIMLHVLEEGVQKQWSTDEMLAELACQFGALFSSKYLAIDPLYSERAHGPTNIGKLQAISKKLDSITLTNTPQKFCANCSDYRTVITPILQDKLTIPSPLTSDYIVLTKNEAGCGSVMRVWPPALIYYEELEKLRQLADQQSLLTHRSPIARASCVAFAVGIAYALLGKSVDEIVAAMVQEAELFDALEAQYKTDAKKTKKPTRDMITKDELFTSDMILYASQEAKNSKEPDVVFGVKGGNEKNNKFRSPDGNILAWAADESAAAAVYFFERFALKVKNGTAPSQAVKDVMVEAANIIGDSDSAASLAGALIGAYTGIIFPDPNISKIENYNYLLTLADAAYTLSLPSAGKPVKKLPEPVVEPEENKSSEIDKSESYEAKIGSSDSGIHGREVITIAAFALKMGDNVLFKAITEAPPVKGHSSYEIPFATLQRGEARDIPSADAMPEQLWRFLNWAAKNDYIDLYRAIIPYLSSPKSLNFDVKNPEDGVTARTLAQYYKAKKILDSITPEKDKAQMPVSSGSDVLKRYYDKTDKKVGLRGEEIVFLARIARGLHSKTLFQALMNTDAVKNTPQLAQALIYSESLEDHPQARKFLWVALVWAAENDNVELFDEVMHWTLSELIILNRFTDTSRFNFDKKRPAGLGAREITPRSVAQYHNATKILSYIDEIEKNQAEMARQANAEVASLTSPPLITARAATVPAPITRPPNPATQAPSRPLTTASPIAVQPQKQMAQVAPAPTLTRKAGVRNRSQRGRAVVALRSQATRGRKVAPRKPATAKVQKGKKASTRQVKRRVAQ